MAVKDKYTWFFFKNLFNLVTTTGNNLCAKMLVINNQAVRAAGKQILGSHELLAFFSRKYIFV